MNFYIRDIDLHLTPFLLVLNLYLEYIQKQATYGHICWVNGILMTKCLYYYKLKIAKFWYQLKILIFLFKFWIMIFKIQNLILHIVSNLCICLKLIFSTLEWINGNLIHSNQDYFINIETVSFGMVEESRVSQENRQPLAIKLKNLITLGSVLSCI